MNKIFKNCFNNFLTLIARSADLGKKAVEELKKEGLTPIFHQLEINNKESVKKFAEYISHKYGGLDILVNNAAILLLVYTF